MKSACRLLADCIWTTISRSWLRSVQPSASNLAITLVYLITVLTASITGIYASVSFINLAPRKNLISPSLPGQLSYISCLCETHLLQLNRKWRRDSGAAPHWHKRDSKSLRFLASIYDLFRPRRSLKLVLYLANAYSKLFLEAAGPRAPAHHLVPHAQWGTDAEWGSKHNNRDAQNDEISARFPY